MKTLTLGLLALAAAGCNEPQWVLWNAARLEATSEHRTLKECQAALSGRADLHPSSPSYDWRCLPAGTKP